MQRAAKSSLAMGSIFDEVLEIKDASESFHFIWFRFPSLVHFLWFPFSLIVGWSTGDGRYLKVGRECEDANIPSHGINTYSTIHAHQRTTDPPNLKRLYVTPENRLFDQSEVTHDSYRQFNDTFSNRLSHIDVLHLSTKSSFLKSTNHTIYRRDRPPRTDSYRLSTSSSCRNWQRTLGQISERFRMR